MHPSINTAIQSKLDSALNEFRLVLRNDLLDGLPSGRVVGHAIEIPTNTN